MTPPATPQETLADIIAQEHGIDLRGKYKNDTELLKGMVNALRLVGSRDADAEYGRQMRRYDVQFREFLASRQQGAPGQAVPQQQQPAGDPLWSNVKEWNPAWGQFLHEVKDPVTGDTSVQYRPGTPMEIQRQIEEYKAWRHTFDTQWQSNPRKMLEGLVGELFEGRFQERFQQVIGQEKEQATAQAIFQQNAQWIYELDQMGRPRSDPFTGEPMLTPRGKAYVENLRVFGELTPDPALADRLAQQMANGQLAIDIITRWQAQQQQLAQPNPMAPALPAPGQQTPATVGIPAPPPGSRYRGNATSGGTPGAPAPIQFPDGMGVKNRILELARRAGITPIN
ncbi:MAG: hypothetical protein K2P78_08000 [Gemmataceae bacterium]|nr:hypothetical protein [Gemmataceae bacterium]